ncbi:MAG: Crp/Fnr family transcriptional regulator [Xanthobacteraceae bacterium]
MLDPPVKPASVRNRVLASLPPRDVELLAPYLHPIEFKVRHVFFEAHRPIETVVFPEAGVASVVATTESGRSIEVGIIGNEGVIGVPVIFGQTLTPYESYAQIAGHGFEMEAKRLWTAMKQSWPMADVLLKFAYAFLVQVTHSALANSRFTIEERLARWLLMAHDRYEGDDVPLTHEFLSMMLGTRRASVTEALHMLQARDLIRATRGHVQIWDRRGLEKCAGSCYGAPESEVAQAEHPIGV